MDGFIGAGAIYLGGARAPPLLRVEGQGGHRTRATNCNISSNIPQPEIR